MNDYTVQSLGYEHAPIYIPQKHEEDGDYLVAATLYLCTCVCVLQSHLPRF